MFLGLATAMQLRRGADCCDGAAQMKDDQTKAQKDAGAGSFPCSKCSCADFLEGNVNDLICNREGCGHGADDHGIY